MAKTDHFITVSPQTRAVVMGLGRFGGGVGVSRWLCQQGCRVIVTDMQPADRLADSVAQLAGTDCEFQLGGHDPAILDDADLLVVNPAVDTNKSEFVQAARRRGIAFTTEINLFVQRCCATIVGITGSVGKSTTTAMIHQALTACLTAAPMPARRAWMGGNIGHSLLADLANIGLADIVILELSSFMLVDTPAIRWSPHVAVVTNVVPNHLDRHGTLAEYADIKKNILRFQTPEDIAILNAEDSGVSGWPAHGRKIAYQIRGRQKLNLLVPGDHNQSNAQAALAVVEALGFAGHWNAAIAALERFAGLPHRLQLVHTDAPTAGRAVRWYNDSKATTPEAAITALRAFPEKSFICIVGGYDKHVDLAEFAKVLATRAAGVLGIGATGPKLICLAAETGLLVPERLMYAQTLAAAVQQARTWLNSSGVASPEIKNVLLSPGCASYDQFPNYEKRGDMFTALVKQHG